MKQKALAEFLGCDIEEVTGEGTNYRALRENFLVLTDEEAQEEARTRIMDSVWAFRKEFLDCHSEIISLLDENAWSAIVSQCELANRAVWAMIEDKEHFIEDAILADGRGHFISNYDYQENVMTVCGETYFIYQQ